MDKTEQEIIKSQILLQRVINLLPIRVFWKDKNLVYLGCNNLFAKDAGKENQMILLARMISAWCGKSRLSFIGLMTKSDRIRKRKAGF